MFSSHFHAYNVQCSRDNQNNPIQKQKFGFPKEPWIHLLIPHSYENHHWNCMLFVYVQHKVLYFLAPPAPKNLNLKHIRFRRNSWMKLEFARWYTEAGVFITKFFFVSTRKINNFLFNPENPFSCFSFNFVIMIANGSILYAWLNGLDGFKYQVLTQNWHVCVYMNYLDINWLILPVLSTCFIDIHIQICV